MTTYLQLKGIDKQFPGVHAVDHVDLGFKKGEVHVLLGENGAGKSPLMQMISGALSADDGESLLRGDPVRISSPQKALELGIGMVYQELSLVPSLSAAENIYLGRQPRNQMGLIGIFHKLANLTLIPWSGWLPEPESNLPPRQPSTHCGRPPSSEFLSPSIQLPVFALCHSEKRLPKATNPLKEASWSPLSILFYRDSIQALGLYPGVATEFQSERGTSPNVIP